MPSHPQPPRRFMRLGIFGGSFDPIHRGHLGLAACCQQQAELDQVWFVPAAQQPLKPAGAQAADIHRLGMLERACGQQMAFKISDIEIHRGGISYTIDTLQAIQADRPEVQLFFLMGADSLTDLPNWHCPAEICQLATPLVVRRAGTREPSFDVLNEIVSKERLAQIRDSQVEMPATPISSSRIRDLISSGGEWQELVPPSVADYITLHGLYGA